MPGGDPRNEVHNGCMVRKSKLSGLGLFAVKKFPDRSVICAYLGRHCQPQDTHGRNAYKFEVKRNGRVAFVIDASDKRQSSIARYVNTPNVLKYANCEFVQHKEQIYLVTLRTVKSGEELLAWYGPHTLQLVKELKGK
jgi:SET domain-containing protein